MSIIVEEAHVSDVSARLVLAVEEAKMEQPCCIRSLCQRVHGVGHRSTPYCQLGLQFGTSDFVPIVVSRRWRRGLVRVGPHPHHLVRPAVCWKCDELTGRKVLDECVWVAYYGKRCGARRERRIEHPVKNIFSRVDGLVVGYLGEHTSGHSRVDTVRADQQVRVFRSAVRQGNRNFLGVLCHGHDSATRSNRA